MMKSKWYETSYRRNILDMYVQDWDEEFFSRFDPQRYVDLLNLAGVDATMFSASSSVGLCNWPAKAGNMHRGLKGRDVLGEVIDLCHRSDINVIVYYSLMNKWAYDNHPEWRIINVRGQDAAAQSRFVGGPDAAGNSRFRVCCLNSPFRDFAAAQIEELCASYEFEGMFFDMDPWPDVCYCPYCRERYAKEAGEEPPTVVDWEDTGWVKFQRTRERWLTEFVSLLSSAAKRAKPGVTTQHNSYPFLDDWQAGATEEYAKQSDYLGGDFYKDSLQQSFICKFLYNLTENKPFEFMTTRHLRLEDHTALKSEELLRTQAYATLANSGVFFFIDAVDPDGTLRAEPYETMGRIFRETREYEKYPGGALCQDVGVYVSMRSKFDFATSGRKVEDVSAWGYYFRKRPHLEGAVSLCKSLLNAHIPFGVITKKNLADLSSHQVVVLPNVLMMDAEEVEAIRDFVASGGSLYASKYTSLLATDGQKKKDFMLSDLFGVSYQGRTEEEVTYIRPAEERGDFFSPYSAGHPLSVFDFQMKVKAARATEVLATVTLPYTNPKETERFVSVVSDPPGRATDYPSITLNKYGRGKVIYSAVDLEAIEQEAHRQVFTRLIKLLASKPFSFETDAPRPVEVVLFHQEQRKRYLINLINFQNELPNIPVEGINIRIRLNRREPQKLMRLPGEEELTYEKKGDCINFSAPGLETFMMFALDYR